MTTKHETVKWFFNKQTTDSTWICSWQNASQPEAVAVAEAGKQCDKYLNMLISLAMLPSPTAAACCLCLCRWARSVLSPDVHRGSLISCVAILLAQLAAAAAAVTGAAHKAFCIFAPQD